MKIYRVALNTTNCLNDSACSKSGKEYIEVENGEIYVTEKDLSYIIENFDFTSIEYEGNILVMSEILKGSGIKQ